MPASSARTASCGTPPPAHPKVASCRRCWPTLPSPSSTSIFAEAWRADSGSTYQRTKRRRAGLANYRIVRYADDFVVLVAGTQAHAETVREDVATVLAPIGLRLSEAKTKVCRIDEGFDFLGATRGRTARVGNVDWRAVMTAT